ncbi:MAG: hypothetical protein JSS02_28520 [Planctomycetes bacterium]|nr:hypothetical protein [Planctomycetota bacterium]
MTARLVPRRAYVIIAVTLGVSLLVSFGGYFCRRIYRTRIVTTNAQPNPTNEMGVSADDKARVEFTLFWEKYSSHPTYVSVGWHSLDDRRLLVDSVERITDDGAPFNGVALHTGKGATRDEVCEFVARREGDGIIRFRVKSKIAWTVESDNSDAILIAAPAMIELKWGETVHTGDGEFVADIRKRE